MDSKQLFFERYDGYREYPERLVSGLTEDQIRTSPHPKLNPIAWVLWHLARCEDVCVNRVLSGGVQVLDSEGRLDSLGVPDRDMGTGMPKSRVLELSAGIDLAELEAYRTDVMARTVEVVSAIPLGELGEGLSLERLRQVFIEEGNGGSVGEEIVEAYSGHTRGWLLGHLVLTHHYYHIGQAFGVRAMFGVGNPW